MSASPHTNNILVIPDEVEAKIRYLQNKFPSTEWSGILFYTHTGNFVKGITITCKDIFPMDLGSSTYTEFFMSEDVAAYVAEHQEELWECDMGLCHSHHSFDCFFSGTDIATLQSEGNDHNTFVSLIVNNAGNYSAAITRKVEADIRTEVTGSYVLWDDGSPTLVKSDSKEKQEIIQYFMLDIQKPTVSSPYQDIDARFEEIMRRKQEEKDKALEAEKPFNALSVHPKRLPKNEEPYLFDKTELSGIDDIQANAEAVHDAVARMLLCSLAVNPSKIDLHKWSANMNSVYDKYFKSADSQKFSEWADWIVQYTLDFFEDEELSRIYMYTSDEYLAVVSKALYKELMQYSSNPYIERYLDSLYSYISIYEQ